MKPLMSFKLSERRLGIVAAVVIGCWSFVSLVVQPLWERRRELSEQAATQQDRLEGMTRLLEQAPFIEQRRHQIEGYMAAAGQEGGEQALLAALETVCRQQGLSPNLKPRRPGPQVKRPHLEVELDVEGTQSQILQMLDELFQLPRLMQVEQVRLAAVPTRAQAGLVRATLLIKDAARP